MERSQRDYDDDLEVLYFQATSKSFRMEHQELRSVALKAQYALKEVYCNPGVFSAAVRAQREADSQRCMTALADLLRQVYGLETPAS